MLEIVLETWIQRCSSTLVLKLLAFRLLLGSDLPLFSVDFIQWGATTVTRWQSRSDFCINKFFQDLCIKMLVTSNNWICSDLPIFVQLGCTDFQQQYFRKQIIKTISRKFPIIELFRIPNEHLNLTLHIEIRKWHPKPKCITIKMAKKEKKTVNFVILCYLKYVT